MWLSNCKKYGFRKHNKKEGNMKWINKFRLAMVLFTVGLLSSASFAETGDDNTNTNKRDASVTELTADQQKMNRTDMEITRLIRDDLMKNSDLSTYAHNIKIITVNGKVTVKGPVRSKKEVNSILNSAGLVAGASNVINQITVVPK